jgi:hypothetical protein
MLIRLYYRELDGHCPGLFVFTFIFHNNKNIKNKQKGRKYFEYQNNGNPLVQDSRDSSLEETLLSINRIRSGHYCPKECFIRFNIVNTEMCECGEAKET